MNIQFKQAHRGNYSPGRTYPIEYIVVHYTANSGDTAQNNADYFAREKTGTSAHYFVDQSEVWQAVKDSDTAYHCWSKNPVHPYCRNANSIGVEMCDSLTAVPEDVMERTAALVRDLMDQYGVDIDHVLRHYDVTGKNCPAPWVKNPGEWDRFKRMLEGEIVTQDQFNAMMDQYLNQRAAAQATETWEKNAVSLAVDNGVSDGKHPRAIPTRVEVMAMVNAAISKLSKG